VLSEVILCATGGEALYADMGHMGRKPIIAAWGLVFVALVASYMGQTSFLIGNPQADNVLFEMIYSQARALYVPFLILSLLATIIASQALISGLFSIMYQSMPVLAETESAPEQSRPMLSSISAFTRSTSALGKSILLSTGMISWSWSSAR
jgi:K+ transporter